MLSNSSVSVPSNSTSTMGLRAHVIVEKVGPKARRRHIFGVVLVERSPAS